MGRFESFLLSFSWSNDDSSALESFSSVSSSSDRFGCDFFFGFKADFLEFFNFDVAGDFFDFDVVVVVVLLLLLLLLMVVANFLFAGFFTDFDLQMAAVVFLLLLTLLS